MTVKRLRIHGQVQGVGFRYSMASRANAIGVDGWVRNRRDGTVEAMISGADADVERLIEWARQGPPGAKVTILEISEDSGDFEGFDLLPTE